MVSIKSQAMRAARLGILAAAALMGVASLSQTMENARYDRRDLVSMRQRGGLSCKSRQSLGDMHCHAMAVA